MNVHYITELETPGLEAYSHLTEAQLRNRLEPEKGIFIAESAKVIRIALEHGLRPLSFLTERKHLDTQVSPMLESCGHDYSDIPVYCGERDLLADITGYELSRGVLCAMHRPLLPTVEAVCDGKSRVAILDNVVNSTNTGAIFRAAAALGVEGIILTPTCCDPLNRRSVRVSMGTVFQLPWTYMEPSQDFAGTATLLRQLGFSTVALALSDKAVPIDSPLLGDLPKAAIVMGTEGDGLPPTTIEACDYVAKIPMQRGVDSLNVAAAASVAFWQLRRR